LKQFILSKEPDKDNIVYITGDDYRYLIRVRRLEAGDFFPALLPNGSETQIQIISIDNNILTGKCSSADLSFLPLQETISPIILFQALPKGDKMDLIVRQAAESGITEIVPFVSEFSIAKTVTGRQKFSRWEKIIKEARQQSGSKIITSIQEPLAMKELLGYWKILKERGALGLLFHHHEKGLEQKSLHEYLNSNPKIAVLVIGPEGGFSAGEVSAFLENDFMPLTIGNTVFRTETAALYCAAAVRIILLEKKSWELKQAKCQGKTGSE
jgi:16S rRNA (uracil1498-N3)-methyltransferase